MIALAGCATQPPPPRASPAPRIIVGDVPPNAGPLWPIDAPSIRARSAILIDARTGRTLYQKDADTRIPAASTQKLLTALLVVERGNLDAMVTIVPSDTTVEPTKLGVRSGQAYSRRALLVAMLVASQNDAAAALGRDHSGSNAAFASAMNREAWQLGARSSLFANPHGLPAPQYSTARDLSRIAFRAYRDPVIRNIVNMRSATFQFTNGRTKHLDNTNKLLNVSWAYNGMKTGYTNASGKCLISSISLNGRDLILVQLGSRFSDIFHDAETMLQWGLSR